MRIQRNRCGRDWGLITTTSRCTSSTGFVGQSYTKKACILHRICTFKKKFGAHSVSLVYEVTADTPFYPQGYVCPGTTYEAPQGIHSFPFIYCHPKVCKRDDISCSRLTKGRMIGTTQQASAQHHLHYPMQQAQAERSQDWTNPLFRQHHWQHLLPDAHRQARSDGDYISR